MSVSSTAIQPPRVPSTGFSVANGAPVPKVARLRIMSSSDWEDVIHEWASSALKKVRGYSEVHRCGGAGDMGRDVIAYHGATSGSYDNFQCKHYDHALYPSDVWVEIGKLCYYTFKGEYALPEKYYFVAPNGVGTTLLRLLEDPALLKKGLYKAWDSDCSTSIINKTTIVLADGLSAHIDVIDFSIFDTVSPVTVVEEHSRTPFHIARFGCGLPARVDDLGPPAKISGDETRYVRQLFDTYAEHAGCVVSSVEDLLAVHSSYGDHLHLSRVDFFSAECLNKFSRDYLPDGAFAALQQDVIDGVQEVLSESFPYGLDRVKATTKHAKLVPIEGHPLRDVIRPRDKAGICHQLANEDRIIWIRKEK